MKKKSYTGEHDEYSVCAYCEHAKVVGGGACVCKYKGMVSDIGSCRKFVLDLLKIKPRSEATFTKEDIEDLFS